MAVWLAGRLDLGPVVDALDRYPPTALLGAAVIAALGVIAASAGLAAQLYRRRDL